MIRLKSILNSTAFPHRNRVFATEIFPKISVASTRMHLLLQRWNQHADGLVHSLPHRIGYSNGPLFNIIAQ